MYTVHNTINITKHTFKMCDIETQSPFQQNYYTSLSAILLGVKSVNCYVSETALCHITYVTNVTFDDSTKGVMIQVITISSIITPDS